MNRIKWALSRWLRGRKKTYRDAELADCLWRPFDGRTRYVLRQWLLTQLTGKPNPEYRW